MQGRRWLVLGLLVTCSACASIRGTIDTRHGERVAPAATLPVPYVAQSELLCGGAAIAMIERWWGRRGVYAEDFATLVHRTAGGIYTGEMVTTMRARGWDAQVIASNAALIQASIADSIPVIALIRVARNRLHYVVITGWRDGTVTFHDPAVAPSVRMDETTFLGRWRGARQWAMIARHGTTVADAGSPTPAVTAAIDSLPCRPWLDRAADAAALDHLEDAGVLLDTASRECPTEAVVLRELAGVRFRQGRHADAARLADAYSRRAPTDSLGWQLLASSRYLTGDRDGALSAWNIAGRPTVDLLRIEGLSHLRFDVVAGAIATPLGDALTSRRLAIAQRRVADIPALSVARIEYTAVGRGQVELRAAVVERPRIDPPVLLVLGEAVRGVSTRQVRLALRTPLGRGELWSAHWRWEPADPRLTLRLDMPARIGIPAIVSLARSWEGYRLSDADTTQRRSIASLGVGGWITPQLEQQLGVRLERWSGGGDLAAVSLGDAVHLAHDRATLLAEAEHAVPMSGGVPAYQRVRSRVYLTARPDAWATTWSARLGAEWASRGAPRGLWSQAGGSLARDLPLRAHPLVVDDVLPEQQRGRASVTAGVAGDRPLTTIGQVAVGVGVFIDAAQLRLRDGAASANRLYVDGGAGVRLGLVGSDWAAMRLDVARGFAADRRWAFTVGLEQARLPRLGRTR